MQLPRHEGPATARSELATTRSSSGRSSGGGETLGERPSSASGGGAVGSYAYEGGGAVGSYAYEGGGEAHEASRGARGRPLPRLRAVPAAYRPASYGACSSDVSSAVSSAEGSDDPNGRRRRHGRLGESAPLVEPLAEHVESSTNESES